MSKKPKLTWGDEVGVPLLEKHEGRSIVNIDETGQPLDFKQQYYVTNKPPYINWNEGFDPNIELKPSETRTKRDHSRTQLHKHGCKTNWELEEEERMEELANLKTKRKRTEAKIAATDNRIKRLKTPRQSPCQGCAIMGGRTRKKKRKSKRRKSKVKRIRKSKVKRRRKSKVKRRRKRRKTKKH